MEQNASGSSDPTRLDRIERIIEVLPTTKIDMQQDLKIVLRAQVVQKHTDQRMDALILTVDEIIRKRE